MYIYLFVLVVCWSHFTLVPTASSVISFNYLFKWRRDVAIAPQGTQPLCSLLEMSVFHWALSLSLFLPCRSVVRAIHQQLHWDLFCKVPPLSVLYVVLSLSPSPHPLDKTSHLYWVSDIDACSLLCLTQL